MTDQILDAVRESTFKTYNNLPETTKQLIKRNAGGRTKTGLARLIDNIDSAIKMSEREQSLLILSIDEDDPKYAYVKIITEAIAIVGDVFIPLENLLDEISEIDVD